MPGHRTNTQKQKLNQFNQLNQVPGHRTNAGSEVGHHFITRETNRTLNQFSIYCHTRPSDQHARGKKESV